MIKYKDFSFLETISIEIGSDCNLKKQHLTCPANKMKRADKIYMTVEKICSLMDEAVKLGFNGYFAFHFYNEPLIYIERINSIINNRKEYKYLLWSNGTLVEQVEKKGYNLGIFDKIVFTCYDKSYFSMLEKVKQKCNDVTIFDADMDDRLNIYDEEEKVHLSCKKIKFEMPIDYEGNVYICTFDWKKKYLLGNIFRNTLKEILLSDFYQQNLIANEKAIVGKGVCQLCKLCNRPYRGRLI